jgi:hypothetical protein
VQTALTSRPSRFIPGKRTPGTHRCAPEAVRKFQTHRDSFSRIPSLVLFVLFPYFLICIYCATHSTNTHAPAGFESAIPAGERSQTLVVNRSATGIGKDSNPGPSSPQRVPIPTTPPRPLIIAEKRHNPLFSKTFTARCSFDQSH